MRHLFLLAWKWNAGGNGVQIKSAEARGRRVSKQSECKYASKRLELIKNSMSQLWLPAHIHIYIYIYTSFLRSSIHESDSNLFAFREKYFRAYIHRNVLVYGALSTSTHQVPGCHHTHTYEGWNIFFIACRKFLLYIFKIKTQGIVLLLEHLHEIFFFFKYWTLKWTTLHMENAVFLLILLKSTVIM